MVPNILEGTPWFQISETQARSYQTTVRNIWHNRTADKIAKSIVKKQLASREKPLLNVIEDAIKWQKWLVHVAVQIALTRQDKNQIDDCPTFRNNQSPESSSQRDTFPSVVDITPQHPTHVFQYYLSKWNWEPECGIYTWKSCFPDDMRPSSFASISERDWSTAIAFLKSLKWCIQDGLKVSYTELAYHFHFCNFKFENANTVSKTTTMLRKVINQSFKCSSEHPLILGSQKSKCISEGKTLPAGYVLGSRPLVMQDAMKSLAVVLLHGRSHALSKWDVPF